MRNSILIPSIILILSSIGITVFALTRKGDDLEGGVDAFNIGDSLLPKGTDVNIRSTPEVNKSNYIYYNYTGVIGTIIDKAIDKDAFVWYKVKLNTPKGNVTEGYVRIDVVKKG
jgi:hypothetical protein